MSDWLIPIFQCASAAYVFLTSRRKLPQLEYSEARLNNAQDGVSHAQSDNTTGAKKIPSENKDGSNEADSDEFIEVIQTPGYKLLESEISATCDDGNCNIENHIGSNIEGLRNLQVSDDEAPSCIKSSRTVKIETSKTAAGSSTRIELIEETTNWSDYTPKSDESDSFENIYFENPSNTETKPKQRTDDRFPRKKGTNHTCQESNFSSYQKHKCQTSVHNLNNHFEDSWKNSQPSKDIWEDSYDFRDTSGDSYYFRDIWDDPPFRDIWGNSCDSGDIWEDSHTSGDIWENSCDSRDIWEDSHTSGDIWENSCDSRDIWEDSHTSRGHPPKRAARGGRNSYHTPNKKQGRGNYHDRCCPERTFSRNNSRRAFQHGRHYQTGQREPQTGRRNRNYGHHNQENPVISEACNGKFASNAKQGFCSCIVRKEKRWLNDDNDGISESQTRAKTGDRNSGYTNFPRYHEKNHSKREYENRRKSYTRHSDEQRQRGGKNKRFSQNHPKTKAPFSSQKNRNCSEKYDSHFEKTGRSNYRSNNLNSTSHQEERPVIVIKEPKIIIQNIFLPEGYFHESN